MPGLRVVHDTNMLVSGVAYPRSVPGRIVTAWRQGGLEVALSRYILDELVRVLPRLPRVQMTPAEVRDLADSFMFLADVVEPEGTQDANLSDPADQPVLLTLLAAKADYLITGNKDLLELAQPVPHRHDNGVLVPSAIGNGIWSRSKVRAAGIEIFAVID